MAEQAEPLVLLVLVGLPAILEHAAMAAPAATVTSEHLATLVMVARVVAVVAVEPARRLRARSRPRILAVQVTPGQVEQEAALAVPAVQAQQVITAMLVLAEISMLERRAMLELLVVLVQTLRDSAQMVHL
jgi:hypothetical protein